MWSADITREGLNQLSFVCEDGFGWIVGNAKLPHEIVKSSVQIGRFAWADETGSMTILSENTLPILVSKRRIERPDRNPADGH
jgi:hypothetical protein